MARPKKCRRICREPFYDSFSPDELESDDKILLTVEEYETIRLVDYEKKTHEQCAAQMEIARTTVTEMYETARHKVADCLVNGKVLYITGGNYKLCDGSAKYCCNKTCHRNINSGIAKISEKGENQMRIAVTYEGGNVFQHFGHTEQFQVYDIEEGKIVRRSLLNTGGSGHGALAGVLKENDVQVLICGGIGGGAKVALNEAGISFYAGVAGDADDAVNALLAGNLEYNSDVQCTHHEHSHSGGAHQCGNHGCGSNGCH